MNCESNVYAPVSKSKGNRIIVKKDGLFVGDRFNGALKQGTFQRTNVPERYTMIFEGNRAIFLVDDSIKELVLPRLLSFDGTLEVIIAHKDGLSFEFKLIVDSGVSFGGSAGPFETTISKDNSFSMFSDRKDNWIILT